ncbi:HpcH/HpaI aldolase/citrate lyase family protein [Woodsholea maritima]|uniref:HpcH/HpaI aldolase/citrate lyase family protein n=1 Tax=Woodsholea maritima TaxID=240237 RepID=UPI00035F4A59|nr:CoA ester lyase [Woodsholea maritima]
MTNEEQKCHKAHRSALYVPGDKPRALEKAPNLGADLLILDLEDAVGPGQKAPARENARIAAASWRASSSQTLLRVNAPDTAEFEADIALAAELGFDGIALPKVESVLALQEAHADLNTLGCSGPLWAVIETPLGIVNLKEICEIAGDVDLIGLIAGTNDLCAGLDCLCDGDRGPIVAHLQALVLHARAFGLIALDGVYNNFRDQAGLIAQTQEGLRLGFEGKTLIHPDQIAGVHAALRPDAAALEAARALVTAFEDPANVGKGAISHQGRMVEAMHYHQALRLIARA